MALTADDLIAAFGALGIDTREALDEYLAPTKLQLELDDLLAQREGELDRFELQSTRHQNRLGKVDEDIAAKREEIVAARGGE